MVQITNYPLLRHLRSEPSRHILHWSGGRLARSGRGLAYWFRPLRASVAEVPCDDRELAFLFHGRSSDFQDITVQGVITWRVVDPEVVADRVDFSVDIKSGRWLEKPLEQLGDVLANRAQQHAWDAIAANDVRGLLERGVEEVRERIRGGLEASSALEGLGIEIVAVSVSQIAPSAELERALQTPAHESIQQQADEATFRRRALAVEKERAIAENELQSRIELATRESELILQRGENDKQLAREQAEAERITVDARAETVRTESGARADSIRTVEEARVVGERERMEIYASLEPRVLIGLAAREFAGKLERIEHLTVTPDMLSQLFTDLFQSGARALDRGAGDGSAGIGHESTGVGDESIRARPE